MDIFLFLVGLIAVILAVVILVIRLFNKKPKKKILLTIATGFILIIIGASIGAANMTPEEKAEVKARKLASVQEKKLKEEQAAKEEEEELKQEHDKKKEIEKLNRDKKAADETQAEAKKQINTQGIKDEEEKRKTVPTKKEVKDKDLEKIIISADYQDIKNGKQKVVLTVKNTSKEIFNGKVKFEAIDLSGKYLDGDTVFIEKLLPGIQTTAITWIKPGASSSEFETSGNFTENKFDKSDGYDVVHSEPGNASQIIFVVTKNNEGKLVEISKELKNQYDSKSMVRLAVFYYFEKNRDDASSGNLDSSFANYNVNYTNGLSELTFSDEYRVVEVK